MEGMYFNITKADLVLGSVNGVCKRERVGTEGQETRRMETTQATCSRIKSRVSFIERQLWVYMHLLGSAAGDT